MSSPRSEAPSVLFSAPRFLEELEQGSASMGAPYSEKSTKTVLDAFGHKFSEGAIQLIATSRPGEPIIYRLLMRKPADTIDIAVGAGLLASDNAIAPIVQSVKSLWEVAYEQCDFSSDGGLVGSFVYLGPLRKLDEVLEAPLMPEGVKKQAPVFHELGLELVQVVYFDYVKNTITLYFIASGPLTKETAAKFTGLAGAAPPTDFLYDEMSILLGANDFFFTVTMEIDTGIVSRVDFYMIFPIELPGGRLPEVGARLTDFWDFPYYEEEEMDILCWCYSRHAEPFIQAERAYCGDLRTLLRDWRIMSVD
ncbi:hypothetical protein PVAG01_05294 [Phlyctema vagabunda]|uniref:Prenyltransferase n=1 Tax=Phlyctema vagabunda TaxID=108571 RepID=A0ABR4PKD1_9HELO